LVFDRSAEGGSASFYFGHSGTILPLFAALGLFRDPHPLRALPISDFTSSLSSVDERQMRSSRIDPMSSNIAFTLYDCIHCQGANMTIRYIAFTQVKNANFNNFKVLENHGFLRILKMFF